MKRLIIASQVSIIWNSWFKMKIPGPPWWRWRICLETNKPKKINFRTSALSFRWWRNVEGGNIPTCIIFHLAFSYLWKGPLLLLFISETSPIPKQSRDDYLYTCVCVLTHAFVVGIMRWQWSSTDKIFLFSHVMPRINNELWCIRYFFFLIS